MRPVKGQPLSFDNEQQQCCEAACWTQICHVDDELSAMFVFDQICPDATEQVTSPNFGAGLTGWTIATPDALGTSDGVLLSAEAVIEQNTAISNGQTYRLRVVRPVPTAGMAFVNQAAGLVDIIVRVGQFAVIVPGSAGTYDYFFVADGSFVQIENPLQNITIDQGTPLSIAAIQTVSIIPLQVPTALIRNEDDTATIPSSISTEIDRDYIIFRFRPSAEMQAAGIFRLQVTQACTAPIVYLSEPIATITDASCTMAVKCCGDVTDWGGTTFQPFIRHDGKLRPDSYEPEVTRYRNSAGRYRTPYGHQRKVFGLYFDRCPEHVRDFVANLAIMETVTVQVGLGAQKAYSAYDQPEQLSFAKGDDYLTGMKVPLIEKENQFMAINENECTPSIGVLVIEGSSENQALEGTTTNNVISAT